MKKIVLLLAVIVMVAVMCIPTSAITLPDGDILGHWKLDGDLKNDTTGLVDAEFSGFAFDLPLYEESEYTWIEGVDGYAWKSDTTIKDGIKFPAPTSQNVTIMEWVYSENCVFTTPLIWWGEQNQSNALGLGGEAWIGVWSAGAEDWGTFGPCIGSNNAEGTRTAVLPTNNPFSGTTLPWTHIAMTIEYNEETGLSYGKLYYNGELAGEGDGLPFVQSADANVYFGVNCWNWPITGYVDDVIIYNEVLSDDEISSIYAQYAEVPTEIVEVSVGGETEPVETEPAETDAPDTKAPETEPADTKAPDTQAPDTAPADEGGCGSVMTGAAAVIITLTATMGCAVIKRH